MHTRRTRFVVVVSLAGAMTGAMAAAHEARERVPIDWKRDPKVAVRRTEAPAPAPEPRQNRLYHPPS